MTAKRDLLISPTYIRFCIRTAQFALSTAQILKFLTGNKITHWVELKDKSNAFSKRRILRGIKILDGFPTYLHWFCHDMTSRVQGNSVSPSSNSPSSKSPPQQELLLKINQQNPALRWAIVVFGAALWSGLGGAQQGAFKRQITGAKWLKTPGLGIPGASGESPTEGRISGWWGVGEEGWRRW